MKLEEVHLAVTTYDYEKFWVYFSTGLIETKINKIRLSLTAGAGVNSSPKPFRVVPGFNQTKLTSLELTDSIFYSLTGTAIMRLPTSLKHLNITHNYVVSVEIEALKFLENLETLDLSNQVEFLKRDSSFTLIKKGQESQAKISVPV